MRSSPAHNRLFPFCWLDVKTRDPAALDRFFARTLGWEFAVDEQDWRKATVISVAGQRIGGVSDLANPVYPAGTPAHAAFYLTVEDAEARTEAALAHGARLVVGPFDAGEQGRMSTLVDPEGVAFSLWQPFAFPGWSLPSGVSGAPAALRLSCADPVASRRFYEESLATPLPPEFFVAAQQGDKSAPQWELLVEVDDLSAIRTRVGALGEGVAEDLADGDRQGLRIRTGEGIAVRLIQLQSHPR
ncbi:VOC family protein [Saccharomonospora sp. NPDC006951]